MNCYWRSSFDFVCADVLRCFWITADLILHLLQFSKRPHELCAKKECATHTKNKHKRQHVNGWMHVDDDDDDDDGSSDGDDDGNVPA